jgi:transposase
MDARRQKICFDIPRIPGIGAKTAFAMLVEMPELGAIEHRDAASLAGLARLERQSGRWAAPLSAAARQAVRQALYMPALVAARYNPELKAKYAKLVEAGKPAKVAAIMRKLLNSSDCAAN